MTIRKINTDKQKYLSLLLLVNDQKNMAGIKA